jgi:malonyl-CoA O-methyltransferase
MTQPIRWLQDEIADRMLQKLDIVKLDVRDVLIVPDFPGKHLASFAKRYPNANIYSLTEEGVSTVEMWRSKGLSHWRSLFKGKAKPLAAFLQKGKFDLPDNSVDLVFSDLLLQDLPDPRHFLQECWRVLREGGLITFSYLGPDTGKELRALEPGLIQLKNLTSPWDMHDIGDALIGERFSDPVMDMEFINLDYDSDALLLIDAQALKLLQLPSAQSSKKEVLPKKMTLEVVYGHSWALGKHLAKAQDSIAYIDVKQIGRKTRSDSA